VSTSLLLMICSGICCLLCDAKQLIFSVKICYVYAMLDRHVLLAAFVFIPCFASVSYFNLYAMGFKWLQSTFTYDIIFAWHLNFCTWFTKKCITSGTKKDLIMD